MRDGYTYPARAPFRNFKPFNIPTFQPAPTLTPLESALLQVLIVDNLKSFRMNVYEKPGGRGTSSMAFCYSLLTTPIRLAGSAHAF
jgi:hypothetical protein